MISFQPTQRDFILFNLNTYGNEAIQVKSVKYMYRVVANEGHTESGSNLINF